jgi:hypothetical protein
MKSDPFWTKTSEFVGVHQKSSVELRSSHDVVCSRSMTDFRPQPGAFHHWKRTQLVQAPDRCDSMQRDKRYLEFRVVVLSLLPVLSSPIQ